MIKAILEFIFYSLITCIPITILGLFNTLFKMYLYEH